jgi:hypothetical protein
MKKGRKRKLRRGVSQFTFFCPFSLPFSMDFFKFFSWEVRVFPFHISELKREKKTGEKRREPQKARKKRGEKWRDKGQL